MTDKEYPWRDGEILEELYWGERMHMGEIAEELGCTRRTLVKWFKEHDIETRKGKPRKPYAYFRTHVLGYERWEDRSGPDRGQNIVNVHRLLAVAKYGIEAVKDMHVHHPNRIPWDNRYDNIELLTASEHSRHHAKKGHSISNEAGLIAQHGEEAVIGEESQ